MFTHVIIALSLWICTARSITGKAYYGGDTSQAVAQEKAMQACQAHSWRCYPTSCRVEIHEEAK